ncbi:N-acetylmuramoyl-L-alanine amidase [candidate division LCP-89 bacterium B3_LCP]|uniref:N-acetylmuramoyl-L-alanine amidase n=1 Tax=candidate division LCP-89 bacterium B3_LCP TaxID=2012998 RepID=A0A532UZH9_UNCL8|nr:MAG: N-acetylmuramoyl-L-alanine amidase [candidate division LCP-89 bacterium B3_LCP]
MKINEDHLLEGGGTTFKESSNHGGAFSTGLPDTVVFHFTAGRDAKSSVQWLCNPEAKASAHLVIGSDKSVTQLVPFDTIAWHAGPSRHGDREGLNKYSIGIELDNAGKLTKHGNQYRSWFEKVYDEKEVVEAVHRNKTIPEYWHAYSEEQITIAIDICFLLMERYGITTILGHEEISPGRKWDPGPAFPLDKIREIILLRDRAEDEGAEAGYVGSIGKVTASKLNIRSTPSLYSTTVAPPLMQNSLVEILRESDGWYEVLNKTQGWVKKEYVKT